MKLVTIISCSLSLAQIGSSSSRQNGSALTELIVLSIVMIPLMFMVPMLGKLVDLRHTAISASRYVAWEEAMGSAANDSSRSAPMVGSRFFASPDSAIVSQHSGGAGAPGNGENPLWGEVNVNQQETNNENSSFWSVFNFQDTVQSNAQSLAASVSDESIGGVAGTVSESIDTMASVLGFADGVRWDLQGGDYARGEISIEAKVGNLLGPVNGLCGESTGSTGTPNQSTTESSICFTESTAILSDTWSVPETENVEEAVESHTRSFVPGVVLEPVGRFLSHLGNLPVVEELEDLEHAFGYVDASQLPDGRSLGNYPE